MRLLRSLFFYVVLVFSTIIFGLSAILTRTITRKNRLSCLCGRAWGNVNLWAAGVKVVVRGLEKLDPNASYILAANHQSMFDIFAFFGKLPIEFRWLAKEELTRIPLFGPAMLSTGCIPIDRSDRKKAMDSLNRAAMTVQEGASIFIFPEGTRSPDGVLQEFKKGGFILALKSRQPVVPISISGSHRILPKKKGWLIKPGEIILTVDNPIATAGFTLKNRDELMAMVREAIRKNLTPEEGGLYPICQGTPADAKSFS